MNLFLSFHCLKRSESKLQPLLRERKREGKRRNRGKEEGGETEGGERGRRKRENLKSIYLLCRESRSPFARQQSSDYRRDPDAPLMENEIIV